MAAYCQELGKFNPGLKVVEVGAASQKARLGDLVDVVEFRVLNAAQDVQEQGFEPGSYDLVIACNVIHATPRIEETLRNIRPLLKPGGKFMIMEVSRSAVFCNLVFGLFEGWWAGYDEGRTLTPIRTPPEWLSMLRRADFENPEKVFEDYSEEHGGNLSVFISSVRFPKREENMPPVYLVAGSEQTKSQATAEQIQSIQKGCGDCTVCIHSITASSQAGGIVVMLPEVAKLLSGFGMPVHAETGIWSGFARSLRLEHPNLCEVTLEIQTPYVAVLDKLAEILPVEKFIGTERILTAELGVPGLLETIRWKDDVEAPCLGPDDVRFELRAASINFKDVLIAAGQLEGITEMRNDCSGVVVEVGANMQGPFKPGDRVCALYSPSYTNYPVVHGDCCQIIPDSMPFAEGASLPIVWATVYCSIVNKAGLKEGRQAGAVGQAAIMLAQHLEAEIFATVGSDAKRDLLHSRYGIPHGHIFSSRTTAFHGGIKELTGGYGVDVVLNSLSGEVFRESCNLVAPFGRFVEIGRKDLMDDALMPMEFLLRNVTFAYVGLTVIIEQKKGLARRLLRDVVDLAAAGSIKAVTLTTIPISQIETAIRQIQAGKHTGKIILTVDKDQEVLTVASSPPQAHPLPSATYIVVGGFGGLGRAILSWMGNHGAQNLAAISRSGANDPESKGFVEHIQAQDVNLLATGCDVSSDEAVRCLAQIIAQSDLPPVRGIINSAMVLNDSLFEEMTVEHWQNALASKVRGSQHLQQHFKDIDFFVMMSSTVAIRGNFGQSNYSAACSFQDTMVRHLTAAGIPAFSINIGPVRAVGYVSENPEVAEALKRNGLGSHDQVAHPATGESVDALSLLGGVTQVEHAVDIICGSILQQLSKLIAPPVEMLSSAQSLDSYGLDSLVAVELL
ncbi:hypothetical protein P175DRAFT_0544951 [Aspergillus ochraceoroseus IBT 24754]|uniref:Uncharacterized protein n=1 Tax=Aspergillus ochraceoroseus IBT 24754 TaxID=1392256 RepID=A0A2T5LZ67_9EURO|nr:uncharacterized protein P175DRAFT_0544951 [Aspergillus ochraceoroseus IBT 24754]PTU21579.1 hypothetical protein P175DRAFT_0544951 [Aspergillus ochraceoroseus IBT 24754]